MPGTPDPVLGSDALTLAVACVASALVASIPFAARDRFPAPRRFALGGGLAYAALCLGAWAGARLAGDAFVSSLFDRPEFLAGLLLVSTAVLGAHAAIPYYLYARWTLRVPLAGLFAVTTLLVDVFLHVRGETDPLGLYALFFGPVVVVGLCVLGLLEAGVRRIARRWTTTS